MALSLAGDGEITGFNPVASGFGKILQVVSVAKTDTFSASVATDAVVSVTGFSVSITPSSATNKILILASLNYGGSLDGGSTNNPIHTILMRNASAIGVGDAASTRRRATSTTSGITLTSLMTHSSIVFLDAPADTNPITYSINIGHLSSVGQTLYLNRSAADTDSARNPRMISTITALEIAA
jgi:hypothetical protein